MALVDSLFKATVTTLGACTVVFGVSFAATVVSGFTYHYSSPPVTPSPSLLDSGGDLEPSRRKEALRRVRDDETCAHLRTLNAVMILSSMQVLERNGSRPSRRSLLYFRELPAVLRFNRFILSGYRAGYSYSEALWSVFQAHNETGNIWTHLLPALLLMTWSFFGMQELPKDTLWVLRVNSFFAIVCLIASVCYHTCMACHKDYHFWLKTDVCGIYGLVLGSQFHSGGLSFPCHPVYARVMLVLYLVVGSMGFRMSCKAQDAVKRALPLLALVVMRLGSLIVRLFIGIDNMEGWKFYALAETFAFLGGTINALKIPERLFKPRISQDTPYPVGVCDYYFNSHQIMHVLVVSAMVCMQCGLASDSYYVHTHTSLCH